MGGGSESSSNYFQSEIVFFGIDNIHAMRDSLARLRDYLDTHGATSSDGMSSFLRHGGWTWGGGNLSSMSASVSTLGDSGWLIHVQNVLAGSAWIAARVALESASVLVHCSDGWDRTTQLVSLASLLLDPYYRTFTGFQWIDCVSQLLRMYPSAFEFSMVFLVDFLDCVLSCRFGNFFCNSEKERQECGVSEACGCLWAYLADLRASEGSSHLHYNFFYDPVKHADALLPPAAALAPILWPQFHLRWACPSEAQAGELEVQFKKMSVKVSELQKAKEVAERKVKEITTAMESLSAELRNEKQLGSLATNQAKRASKENEAIKRAVQSLGCNVHFSTTGDCTFGIESNPPEIPQKFINSSSKRNGTLQNDEKSDLSVSITLSIYDSYFQPEK
nr:phosphatidylinositol-3-phosphatase myotubularin-1 [Quercus suber]